MGFDVVNVIRNCLSGCDQGVGIMCQCNPMGFAVGPSITDYPYVLA